MIEAFLIKNFGDKIFMREDCKILTQVKVLYSLTSRFNYLVESVQHSEYVHGAVADRQTYYEGTCIPEYMMIVLNTQ